MKKTASAQEALDQELVVFKARLEQQWEQVTIWFLVVAAVVVTILLTQEYAPKNIGQSFKQSHVGWLISLPFVVIFLYKLFTHSNTQRQISNYQLMSVTLKRVKSKASIAVTKNTISRAKLLAKDNILVSLLLKIHLPALNERLAGSHQANLTEALDAEFKETAYASVRKIIAIKEQVPVIRLNNAVNSLLETLVLRRIEMFEEWQAGYKDYSWWNKIKYSSGPDYTSIDEALGRLVKIKNHLKTKHEEDFIVLDEHFDQLRKQTLLRLIKANEEAKEFIQHTTHEDTVGSDLLRKSLLFSAMSIPVSAWSDMNAAGDVYDALRGVNGNFADMSDTEIWWESLFMPAESLAGLTALTKGAYFEQLVAADTGGELHEHFNQADTDIVIDGVAFQIKATDSESYIESVDESIPVIATSEVANVTGVIDGNYSNEELTIAVESALGGSIFDVADTTVDAILVGLGGLGFLATLRGIKHIAIEQKRGRDSDDVIDEGIEIALEGTAKALVGTAEMGYNILASKPSRFVGRSLLKLLKKLGEDDVKK